jgi:glycosyltransferase involved in cell wall biosynthesis
MKRQTVAFCTIVARNYLAYALTLLVSASETHPEAARYVLIVDGFDRRPEPDLAEQGILVVCPPDFLPYETAMALAYSYDITEYSTALKPFLLRHLLDRGHQCVLYIDPDILILESLQTAVLDPLGESSIVLTPHTTDPIPLDGRIPTEVTLLLAGAYNLGFIGVRDTAETRRFLAWWSDRLERYCVNQVEKGLFVDQKWIDLVPGMFPATRILRDRGLNVAYWNLHARALFETADGALCLRSGEPLLFFHFSGFDASKPNTLSRHQDRVDVAMMPALERLLGAYADRLAHFDHARRRREPYAHARFSDGTRVDATVRAILRDARERGLVFPEPRDVDAVPSLLDYCNATDPGDPGGNPRVTRYLKTVHASRVDLQAAFPNVYKDDRGRFWDWLHYDEHHGIDPAFIEGALKPPRERSRGLPIVNVAGYFSVESGVGEAGRAHVAGLRAAGCDTYLIDVSATAALSRQREGISTGVGRTGAVNLVCVNADQVTHFASTSGRQLLTDRYNIGSWWWELPEFPEELHDRFAPFDEIWVGSDYVRAAIGRVAPIPVVRIPPIVAPPPVRDCSKERFGIARDEFVFLYFFDYLSEFERKNPIGAIDAFKAAFPTRTDVRLIIKSINAERDPANALALARSAADDPRIDIREAYLTRDEKNALLAAADCYISLHRAEGFGLTLAEAMYYGTPIICTGWSGNVDFTNGSNAFIVDAPLVRLRRDYGPYAAGQQWADPDIEHAASGMRQVVEEPQGAFHRAVRAQYDIRREYSAAAVGAMARSRLSHVLDLGRSVW